MVWEGEFGGMRVTTRARYLRRRTDDIEGAFAKSLAHGIKEDHDKVRSFTCVAESAGLDEPFLVCYDEGCSVLGIKRGIGLVEIASTPLDTPIHSRAFSISKGYIISPSTSPGVSTKVILAYVGWWWGEFGPLFSDFEDVEHCARLVTRTSGKRFWRDVVTCVEM